MDNRKFTKQELTSFADGIRAGVNACLHHARYTKRVTDAIEKAIIARVDFVPVFSFGVNTIGIWGGGVNFEQRAFFCWSWGYYSTSHWSAPILAECDRMDCRDVIEREHQEAGIAYHLAALENLAEHLQVQIEDIRKQAAEAIKALPIPAMATVRKSQVHWDSPTDYTSAKYPTIFPK